MARTTSPAATADPASVPGRFPSPMPLVPTTRAVASLSAAMAAIRRLGGAVTSETRSVPGIGSWAFVTEGDGREVVLWEAAAPSV